LPIGVGPGATDVEGRYARLLSDRVHDATGIELRITTDVSGA
jgi:hypothetical protein